MDARTQGLDSAFNFAALRVNPSVEVSETILTVGHYSGDITRPAVIRFYNGREFTGKAMVSVAYRDGVILRPVESGKPNQHIVFNFRRRRRVQRSNMDGDVVGGRWPHWLRESHGRSLRRSRRRTLPEADFGITSMKCTL